MKTSFNRIVSHSLVLLLIPATCFASVDGMLNHLQSAVLNVVAPVICVFGIVYSGFKMAMGDESAKKMLALSCFGTIITFTAPAIINYLKDNVAG